MRETLKCFKMKQLGEEVEYDLERGSDGRLKALNVTGPKGAHCQGTPPQERDGGGRGGGGGGYY